mmetsp:Transcript_33868/g.39074  ORF Transcript_33868/g.39074 Transcript_33868/m.39074 type:complete len:129 (-) Transcript_33868:1972-2358(-)
MGRQSSSSKAMNKARKNTFSSQYIRNEKYLPTFTIPFEEHMNGIRSRQRYDSGAGCSTVSQCGDLNAMRYLSQYLKRLDLYLNTPLSFMFSYVVDRIAITKFRRRMLVKNATNINRIECDKSREPIPS